MRKFNLKGTVVQRMRGIEREEPEKAGKESIRDTDNPETNASFSLEQGAWSYAWRTDVGRLRKINQDAVILGNGLAGVADGMGGHKGGEIASAGLRTGLMRETKNAHPDEETLVKAVKKVNRELWLQQEEDPSLSGMGTTLTILWPAEGKMIIGQIGDSRAYLLRDDTLVQITNDHSMVADMVRKGVLTEEQAACHPMRNYITRAVATDENVEVDLFIHDRKKGDRWLVCSDGLYGMVHREKLQELSATENLEEAAEKLLNAALEGGGKDNITLILLQDNTETAEPNRKDANEAVPVMGEIPGANTSEEVTSP